MTLRELINQVTDNKPLDINMSPVLDYELEVWNTDSMSSTRLEVNKVMLDSTTGSIQLEV